MDIGGLRAQFPITQRTVFLNNAAESPLCLPVRRRLDEYFDVVGGSPDRRPDCRTPVRQLLARLLGGLPEEYALVPSTGVGIGMTAAGYPWEAGDNVVVPAEEHGSNTYPWLALRERGVELRLVPVGADQRIDPAEVAARVDSRTRMVAVAAVRHLTGFRADLRALSPIARAVGALFVVDGIQAAGMVPLNVEDDGIDVLACGGYKWLLGSHGTGFLYVRKGLWERIRPVLPGMYSAEGTLTELRWLPGALRYETGSLPYSLFYAWTAGLEWVLDLGVSAIQSRVLDLTDGLIVGLRSRGLKVVSPVEHRGERSAIVSFTVGSAEANNVLSSRLAQRGIAISVRGGFCRVSPSFYNTEDEIEQLLVALGG